MAPMDVATSFLPVLQVFAAEMSRPAFQTFSTFTPFQRRMPIRPGFLNGCDSKTTDWRLQNLNELVKFQYFPCFWSYKSAKVELTAC